MMNTTLTAPLFDIVLHYRLAKRQNMHSDMLELDLCFILLGWD